jgi:hypothetical protein
LSKQTTTKTLLPTVLLLLPSFQALQFQSIILILYNLDDYNRDVIEELGEYNYM